MASPKLKNGLRALQNAFARHVANGMAYSDAYRAAGYSPNMGDKSINEASSRLMNDPVIVARIEQLRERIAILADIDSASVASEMEQARRVALEAETPQVSAAVAASKAKANLAGLLMPSTETTSHSLSITATLDTLSPEDLRELLQLGTQAKQIESGSGNNPE